MKVTVTYIQLKSPLKVFPLSKHVVQIMKQLKASEYKAFKKSGFWTKHYTMTLWNSDEELKAFANNGAHLEAMKNSARIAKEIKTITVNNDKLPSWKEAKQLLDSAKPMTFG